MSVRYDDQLINQLVTETCDRASREETNLQVLDFKKHFDKQTNIFGSFSPLIEYLESHSVEYIKCHFESRSSCYRGQVAGQVVDFPSNWSLFSQVNGQSVYLAGNFPERDVLINLLGNQSGDIVEASFYFSGEILLIALWSKESFSKLYESFMFMGDDKIAA